MKQILTIFLIILFANTGQSNGLDRLEIWGWHGQKQEFRDLYFERTGIDLTNSSACAAELLKMGFKNALSIIYPDDIQAYLTGNIIWGETDRLVIIREFPETRFSEKIKDTLFQNTTKQLINNLKNNPELLNKKSLNKEFTNAEIILLGAINPVNTRIRDNSNMLIRELCIDELAFGENTTELLNIMMSTPDPMTFYNAMTIIGNLSEKKHIATKVDFRAGQTLKEFVFSDLQTFQPDAIGFLTVIYPDKNNWSVEKWKEWFNEK